MHNPNGASEAYINLGVPAKGGGITAMTLNADPQYWMDRADR